MEKKYLFQNANLTARERAADLIRHLTLEEKIGMVTTDLSEVPRLGIKKEQIGVEIARGLVHRGQRESTILPQPWGMAAMFDDALMEKLGNMAGDEVRISNQMEEAPTSLVLYGPTVDMERDPRWGRNEEAYGEDPHLAGKMSAAFTRGLKGSDSKYIKTAPLLKHFYANNYEDERQTTNANITPRMKYDYYLKPFEIATREGGAVGLMTAYNSINGVEGINNPDVSEICKKQWGMVFAVSDGGDFGQNVAAHRTYKNHAQSIADILGTGADMMLDSREMVEPAIREALKNGYMSEEQLDLAVFSLLELRFMLGDFDDNHVYANMDKSKLACSAHKQLAVEAARKSMMLLENRGILPLQDDGKCKIAVLGPLSNENYIDIYTGYATHQTPVVKGFIEKLGEKRVLFDEGLDHVVIKSLKTGRYMTVGEDNVLFAGAENSSEAEVFERNDWDFGSWTLRSTKSRKYVTENRGYAGIFIRDDKVNLDIPMRCCADEASGWFVMEIIKAETDCEGTLFLKSWHGRSLVVNDDDRLVSISGLAGDGCDMFAVEVISDGKERAARLAAEADYAIVCGGNQPMINAREEYDRPDIRLPKSQSALLEAVCRGNSKTILYLVTGYPFSIVKEKDMAQAVLVSTHLGPCLGHVAAETIFGENIPAGRTPTTWYKSVRNLPAIDDYDILKNNMTYLYQKDEALYPFGYGLSYTTFEYAGAALNQANYEAGECINVSVTITNTGAYDADEVVQLYVVPAKSYYKRPVKMLKAFRRESLKCGETKKILFAVNYDDLAFWSTEHKAYVVDAGEYTFEIGASSTDIRASLTAKIEGKSIKPRNAEVRVEAIDTEDYGGLQFLTDKSDGQPYIQSKGLMGYAVYPAFDLSGVNAFEALISSPSGRISLTIVSRKTGEILGHYSGLGTGGLSSFSPITCDIASKEGITDIMLRFAKDISVKSFRFFTR